MNFGEHKYIPGFREQDIPIDEAWILAFSDKKLLMWKTEDRLYIPEYRIWKDFLPSDTKLEYIGSFNGHNCYCTLWNENTDLPVSFERINIREITSLTGEPELFLLAGNANHILHWRSINRYCGRCSHSTADKKDERAIICPACGNIVYPRISPATITAILHEDKILLAHNSNFREGLYSLIAGYVEPGESLEQCVEREIREEVGVKVKNIKYWNSQPWPFPDSLMLAFTAEYESGDIMPDQCEITDAAFFEADGFPDIPSIDSIAGKMIRWFRDNIHTNFIQ